MAKNYISTVGMPHSVWMQKHGEYIGGSGASAALGLNPWVTPYQYYKRIVHGEEESQKELESDAGRKSILQFGLAIEPFIADQYAEKTGFQLRQDNKIRFHPDFDFLGANLDRAIHGNVAQGTTGVWEGKSASAMAFRNWNGEVPIHYKIQVLHYMNITGWEWGVLCVFIPERRAVLTFAVERDDLLIKKITARLVSFWKNNIEARVPPPPVSDRDLLELYPVADPLKTIEATKDIARMAQEFSEARVKRLKFEKIEKEMKEKIMVYMLDSSGMIYDDNLIATCTSAEKNYFNLKGFWEDKPEVAEDYMATRNERRFTVKKSITDISFEE